MPATCRHVEYPNHPKAHFRNPCGADLLSLVSRNKSKPSLQANKEYCYQHLTDAIGLLINQPNFLEKCEQWRNRGGDSELLVTYTMEKSGKNFRTLMKRSSCLFLTTLLWV